MHAAPPQTFFRGARGGPSPSSPPPSPQGGGGRGVWGNQSYLTADMWFHLVCGNTISVRSKRSLREGQRCHPEEPPSGATLRSHPQEPPSGPTHPLEPPSGATLGSRSPLYTRHIRKTR